MNYARLYYFSPDVQSVLVVNTYLLADVSKAIFNGLLMSFTIFVKFYALKL